MSFDDEEEWRRIFWYYVTNRFFNWDIPHRAKGTFKMYLINLMYPGCLQIFEDQFKTFFKTF